MVRRSLILSIILLLLVSLFAGCRLGAQAGARQPDPPPGPPADLVNDPAFQPVDPEPAPEDSEPEAEAEYVPPIYWAPVDEAAIPAVPPADMAGLEALVREYLSKQKGVYGVFLLELDTGETMAVNADTAFRAASTFKLPMAIYILDLVEEGKADLDEMLAYEEDDFEEGAGSLQVWIKPEDTLPVRKLIDLAITESDNIATNMLLRRFGWWNVHMFMRQHGATVTLDEENRNVTTPRDMAHFMTLAVGDQIIQSDQLRGFLLDLLTHTVFRDRIDAGVPDEIPVAHKVGTLDGVINDVGLVLLPGRPYVLSVFSDGVDWGAGTQTIGTISRMVYEYEKARLAGLPEEGTAEGPGEGPSGEPAQEPADEPAKDPLTDLLEDLLGDLIKDPTTDPGEGPAEEPGGQPAPGDPPPEGTGPAAEEPSGVVGPPEEDAGEDQNEDEQADSGVDPVTEPQVDEEGGGDPEEGSADQDDQPGGDQVGSDGDGEAEEKDGQPGGQEEAGEPRADS